MESADRVPDVLAIGMVAGGARASRDWDQAIRAAAKRVTEASRNFESPVHVNVVFYVPGEVHRANFQGVRTGRSSDRGRSLMVQVALPESPTENAESEIRDWLVRAVDAAEEFARRRGIDGLPGLRELLKSL